VLPSVKLDADLAANPLGDKLVVAGATSGASAVSLILGPDRTFLSTPLVLITAPGSGSFALDGTSAAALAQPNGLVSYSFGQLPGTDQWGITSKLNTAAAMSGGSQVAALISGLNTSFFQATSAFISGPSNPTPNEISGGPWIRFASGDDKVSSQSSATVGGASTGAPQAAKDDTSFAGYQAGVDGGIFNIDNTGMNVHLGVTGGQAFATTTDRVTAAQGGISKGSSEIPFVGVYGAITGNNFFADVMWREDFYHMTLTDITTPGTGGVTLLNGNSEKATAETISGDMGYHFAIGKDWFVEPSAAIYVSHASPQAIGFLNGPGTTPGSGGTVTFNDIDSNLGRVGFRVGTSFVTGNLALQPFATAALWHEFAGPVTSTYNLPGAFTADLSTTRIGTFEQFGLGLSGQLIGSNLLGYIRADLRTGANIQGWDITGGLRYQFQ
jgi:hypothetical protein